MKAKSFAVTIVRVTRSVHTIVVDGTGEDLIEQMDNAAEAAKEIAFGMTQQTHPGSFPMVGVEHEVATILDESGIQRKQ